MQQILLAFLSLLVPSTDAEALLRVAPRTKISTEHARLHIAAARIAGYVTDVDPDLILATAYHESRFDQTVRGPILENGKRACGVMQHVPMKICPEPSLLRDYLAGAKHLKWWIDSQRGDVERGLAGYAGGYPSLERYNKNEDSRVRKVVRLNLARARRIKSACAQTSAMAPI